MYQPDESFHTPPVPRTLSTPPPRLVDPYTKAVVLFGGFLQQFGWIFFTMGSMLSWIFIPQSEVMFWLEWKRDLQEISGRVIGVGSTNASVNENLVYRNRYSFNVDGRVYTGHSYSYGQTYAVGDEVSVLYDSKAPAVSYIKGAKRAVFPAIVLFVLLFPIIGLAFILSSLRENWKALRLLENGQFTRGNMTSKERTNSTVKINNVTYPVYKYTFKFQVAGRGQTATCRTYQAWKVEDEEQEIILYDPSNPNVNVVYDAVPSMPVISAQGDLEPAPVWKVIFLILPLLGISLNLYFLWKGAPFGK